MHIILVLLLIIGAVYLLLFKQRNNKAVTEKLVNGIEFSERIAFISKGKLFYRDEKGDIHQIHSTYVQEMMDRVERNKQRHGWKDGTSFGTSFTSQKTKQAPSEITIQVTSAQFCGPDKLIYFLVDDSFGGLFEYDLNNKEEKRLLHKQNLRFDDIEINQQQSQIICSSSSVTGISNITIMNIDGSENIELTGGDTIDASPTWVDQENNQIVFESCGLARNEDGFIIAYGPSSLQLFDKNSGEMSSIVEDDNFDFISPKVCKQGKLYFIRRPYEVPKYSSSNFFLDFILFPFRLLRAVFHYLNFFSLIYSKKPLTSASGPKVQTDLKDILIKGKRIDAEKALSKETKVYGVPSLVPKSWELISRATNGEEQILATNVAAFNITKGGKIIFTNGYGVFLLDEKNNHQVIFKDKLIANLIVG
ncbi:hypothetical protein [Aliikangiella sp. IMCC44359]|uniref:hypothetical protein n=1 Tax=Aliikangiella sp. IMCC44359 TaxID=3459125 RepID=UPI00403AF4B6